MSATPRQPASSPNTVRNCEREAGGILATYGDIVEDYIRCHRRGAQEEFKFFRECSLRRAIRFAALCKCPPDDHYPDGKRHPHHRRRSSSTLFEVEGVLQARVAGISRCRTFDDLHQLIRQEIHQIRGIGPLAIYDIATWIGANRGLSPERIYLHAGALKGARTVIGTYGREPINPTQLPMAFRRLRPSEVEDCFCIYKGDLSRINGHRRSRPNRM